VFSDGDWVYHQEGIGLFQELLQEVLENGAQRI
jgi:hypothetical protein